MMFKILLNITKQKLRIHQYLNIQKRVVIYYRIGLYIAKIKLKMVKCKTL